MRKNIDSGYYAIAFIIIGILIFLYQTGNNYLIKRCQNKYGFSYNMKRRTLGIPIIPKGWHTKERDPEFIWWTGKENIIGHSRKEIVFSGCDIKEELDTYTLPLQNREKRWIGVDYYYRIKPRKDSVIYTYQIEHLAKNTSKSMVDSILTAENINKDY